MLSHVSVRFYFFNALISISALLFLGWLLLVHRGTGGADLHFMPAVNASLNATSALLLVAGWRAIKRGNRQLHQYLMVSAFAASALFLICYVAYHAVHGDTKFGGVGLIRPAYFFILISHVLLSMSVVPLALSAFYFAWKKDFFRHKKVTRFLAPIWLYVSVTGVVVFFLLRGYPTAV